MDLCSSPCPPGSIFFSGGNVGIGTTGPAAPLEVSGQNSGNVDRGGIQIDDRGDGCCSQLRTTSGHTTWDLYSLNGSGLFTIYGVTTHTGGTGVGSIFNITDSGYVGIGTTSPQQLLDVAGTMAAREVIVTQTGADYVFGPDYRLAPLTEIASYIKEHHHLLPGFTATGGSGSPTFQAIIAPVAQYQLTTAVSPASSGTIAAAPCSSNGYYSNGTMVALTAAPGSGYQFTNWSNGSTANPLSVTMSSAQSVTANFAAASSQPVPQSFISCVSSNGSGSNLHPSSFLHPIRCDAANHDWPL